MHQKLLIVGLILILLMTGCSPASQATEAVDVTAPESTEAPSLVITPAEVTEETEGVVYPAPTTEEVLQETTYPAPGTGDTVSTAYPSPSTGTGDTPYPGPDQSMDNNLASPMDAVPGEDGMTKGQVFVDSAQVSVLNSNPTRAGLALVGTLPTPCHYLRATLTPPDAENKISIELYSLVEQEIACVTVLKPFETTIDLGSFPPGTYTIWVNGTQVGEYTQS